MDVKDRNIKVKIDGNNIQVPRGTSIESIAKSYQANHPSQIVAAKVNNRISELTEVLDEDCELQFIDLSMDDGIRIYIRGLTFIFIRACRELFPNCSVSIEHSMSKGLYCEVHGDFPMTPRQVSRIQERMKQIVELDEPFVRYKVSIDEAKEIFKEMKFYDKLDILEYRPEDYVNLYRCGWMTDYLYGYMVPSTGYLKTFELKFYLPGIIIRYPLKETGKIPEFEDNPKLFRIFRESEKWSKTINVENVAQLNNVIKNGKGGELIRICEVLHEKQIAKIADEINNQRDRIRLVLIAGPSSSGKTTFAERLRIQLMVNGLNLIPISMDNYFFNREDIPVGEDGQRDLESIDIIDIELFNEQLTRLIQGQEVEIPYYNFEKGEREYRGTKVKLGPDQLIIVEGIHGLNEKLTAMIPKANKFKIYISALTQLNVDSHNRIPTTDTRLIRRMIRDYQFRGTPIEGTLSMWSSVRRGEEKNIFPFQEQADVMFNSALIYELAVLKPYILPLLEEFEEDHPFYTEVNRLKKFLKYFVDLGPDEIPNNSILREFIGGSCFHE